MCSTLPFFPFDPSMRCASAAVGSEQAVYVLVDPRDETVRYVGRTRSPQARAIAHTKPHLACNAAMRAWAEELGGLGLSARLEVVGIDPAPRALSPVESALISKLRQGGHALYNRSHNSTAAAQREAAREEKARRNPSEPSNKSKAQTARWQRIRANSMQQREGAK